MEDKVELFRRFLEACVGCTDGDVHLEGTPERVVRMYEEVFKGLQDPEFEFTVFPNDEGYDQIVALYNVPFYSFCAHHLVPFWGKATLAYLPHRKIVGLSKLARALDYFAARPQVQERLTQQLGDFLWEKLEPFGVSVILKAEHACIAARGVKKPGSVAVTSYMRGALRDNAIARQELLALVGDHDC